ncbi:MAG TPA: hypothetical protein VF954_07275 [Acidimicrobiales bacterium]
MTDAAVIIDQPDARHDLTRGAMALGGHQPSWISREPLTSGASSTPPIGALRT